MNICSISPIHSWIIPEFLGLKPLKCSSVCIPLGRLLGDFVAVNVTVSSEECKRRDVAVDFDLFDAPPGSKVRWCMENVPILQMTEFMEELVNFN